MSRAEMFTSGVRALKALILSALCCGATLAPPLARAQSIDRGGVVIHMTGWTGEITNVTYESYPGRPGHPPGVTITAAFVNTAKVNLPLNSQSFETEITDATGSYSYRPVSGPAFVSLADGSVSPLKNYTLLPGAKVKLQWRYIAGADVFERLAYLKITPRINLPGFAMTIGKPAMLGLPAPQVPTFAEPPPQPLKESGHATYKVADPGFHSLGAWRVRFDQVVYGSANGPKPGLVDVGATFQNVSTSDMAFPESLIAAKLTLEDMPPVSSKSIHGVHDGKATTASLMIPPGGVVTANLLFYLDALTDRAKVRRVTLGFAKSVPFGKFQIPGEASVDLTPYDAKDRKGSELPAGVKDASAGFVDAGYYELRAEAVRQTWNGGVQQVEVFVTARNPAAELRRVSNNPDRVVLVGSNGVEYKPDGNYYGSSSRDPLRWGRSLYKGEQVKLTYLFPNLPASVKPDRLVVRDGAAKFLAEFRLANMPPTRPSYQMPWSGSGIAAGDKVALKRFEARLVSLARADDGDWDAVVAMKNPSKLPIKITPSDIDVSLMGVDGETRHSAGSFYSPNNASRQAGLYQSVLLPGAENTVRLWFQQSGDIQPTRYRFTESYGDQKDGDIPATFIKKPAN